MTTAHTAASTPRSRGRFRLPDPPQRQPDEMTSYDHLHKTGNSHHLALHFGNPETTLVEADRWIVPHHEFDKSRARRPDLLIAFNVSPADYEASNGYIISEQGKPPDFVMEVASESTAAIDINEKRAEYAALGIAEYWRFDRTGRYHGARLAGDRLAGGRYDSIEIEQLAEDVLQGYSATLNLYLRWERGQLGWYDPGTGRHIATAQDEREARLRAEVNAESEREARLRAEARIRELEDQLHHENS